MRWLNKQMILAFHSELIDEHGGADGVRDEGLLQSALARPVNLEAYAEEADLADLAAAYGFGIAKNHPFVDGNKRTALIAIYVFLGLNGIDFDVQEEAAYFEILELAAGNRSEDELANWIRVTISHDSTDVDPKT